MEIIHLENNSSQSEIFAVNYVYACIYKFTWLSIFMMVKIKSKDINQLFFVIFIGSASKPEKRGLK